MKKKIIFIPAIFIVAITLFLIMSAKYFKPKQIPYSNINPTKNMDNHIEISNNNIEIKDNYIANSNSNVEIKDNHIVSSNSNIEINDKHIVSSNNNIESNDSVQLIYTPKPEHIQNKNNPILDKQGYVKVVNKNANALQPLKIKTYDGMNQPMHPDIIYFENGFNGYKYWMAYTPYPFQIDRYENPCISTSNDGISWTTPRGLKNPIVEQPNDSKSGGHYSDTDIIYDNGKLIVHFVYNKFGIEGPSKFFQVTSSDGINWSKPELIYKCAKPISGYSPGIIKDNDNYKMWYISEGNIMSLATSNDGRSWNEPLKCNISIDNWTIWHVDVIKTDIGYEGLLCAKDNNIKNRALFYIKSDDGINWTTSTLPIVYPSNKGWDSIEIYRSTMLKQNGLYRIWYSARGPEKVWNIGYTEGKTMETLQGYKE